MHRPWSRAALLFWTAHWRPDRLLARRPPQAMRLPQSPPESLHASSDPPNNFFRCPARSLAHRVSGHGNFFFRGGDRAVVIGPGELERPALFYLGMKLDVRVGGDRRIHVGREHRLAVKFTRELVDDLARNCLPIFVLALTRLHDVGQQGLDL